MGCIHDAHEDGLVVHGALQVFDVDQAIGLHGQIGDAAAGLLEALAGVQRRLMLGHLGDDVVAALAVHLCNALDGEVGGFGRAGGKDDLLRGCADELGDLFTGLFDALLSLPAEAVVAARRIAEDARQVGHHGFQNARIQRCGRMVIHVNR
jgi:hypothetical protein